MAKHTLKILRCSKTIFAKSSTLDVLKCPKKYQLLVRLILLLPTFNTSPKSIDPMQNTSPFFNNPLPHPTIKLWRIKTFKTGFKRLSILSKFWQLRKFQGVGAEVTSLCTKINM